VGWGDWRKGWVYIVFSFFSIIRWFNEDFFSRKCFTQININFLGMKINKKKSNIMFYFKHLTHLIKKRFFFWYD
jgi:hypothetical protein